MSVLFNSIPRSFWCCAYFRCYIRTSLEYLSSQNPVSCNQRSSYMTAQQNPARKTTQNWMKRTDENAYQMTSWSAFKTLIPMRKLVKCFHCYEPHWTFSRKLWICMFGVCVSWVFPPKMSGNKSNWCGTKIKTRQKIIQDEHTNNINNKKEAFK